MQRIEGAAPSQDVGRGAAPWGRCPLIPQWFFSDIVYIER